MSKGLRFGVQISVAIFAIAFIWSAPVEAQTKGVVFGVKPGFLPVQSAYLGYSAGRIEPYVGLDLVSASLETTDRFGTGEEDKSKVSALLLIPHFGGKLYFQPERPAGAVSPYLLGAFFFSVASLDGGDAVDPATEDEIKDILEFWGLSVAFGAEYSFSDRFALGGEFGLRYLHDGAKESGPSEFADEIAVAFAATYAALTLNFRI